MAVVKIPEEKRTLSEPGEVTAYLAGIGITYERWEPAAPIAAGAPPEAILAAYAPEIERLKGKGGYEAQVLTGHAAQDEEFTGGVAGPIEA